MNPQKATQSVPKKNDSVNQQPPQTTHQNSPEHTSTQTSTPNYLIPLQMILPEPIAETVVPESVHVTESEPYVTVTFSEPIQKSTQKPTQTIPSMTIKDQPSSSSSPSTQKLKQTPPQPSEV